MYEKFNMYVNAVSAEIRWEKARPALTAEIFSHLIDQKDAYCEAGMSKSAAEDEAIRQMGDPVEIGKALDLIYQPKSQRKLLVFSVVLMVAGAMLRYFFNPSMTSANVFYNLSSIALGGTALAIGYLIDVGKLVHRPYIYMGGLVAVVLIDICGPNMSLSMSWITDKASWLANTVLLVLFPIVLAFLLWHLHNQKWRFAGLCIFCAGIGMLVSNSVYNWSTAVLIASSMIILGFFFAQQNWFGVGKWKGIAFVLILGVGMLVALFWTKREWILISVFPELEPVGRGYIGSITRNVLSQVGWLGHAIQSEKLLDIRNDAVLTNLVCRFGWLPFVFLLSSFLIFFFCIIWKISNLKQTLMKAVCIGGVLSLLYQVIGGLLYNFRIPAISICFPLIMGNWNTILDMILIGLMLSCFRDMTLPEIVNHIAA